MQLEGGHDGLVPDAVRELEAAVVCSPYDDYYCVRLGMAFSLVFMLIVRIEFATAIAWTWYVLFGTIICFSVGYAVSLTRPGVAIANETVAE